MRKSKINFIAYDNVNDVYCFDTNGASFDFDDWDCYKVTKSEHIMRILQSKGIELKIPEGVKIPLSRQGYMVRNKRENDKFSFKHSNFVVTTLTDVNGVEKWYLCINKYPSCSSCALTADLISHKKAMETTLDERTGFIALDDKYLTEEAIRIKYHIYRHEYGRIYDVEKIINKLYKK